MTQTIARRTTKTAKREVLDVEKHMETWRSCYKDRKTSRRAKDFNKALEPLRRRVLEHFARIPETFDEMPAWIEGLNEIGNFDNDYSYYTIVDERNSSIFDEFYFLHLAHTDWNQRTPKGRPKCSYIRVSCDLEALGRFCELSREVYFASRKDKKRDQLLRVLGRYELLRYAARIAFSWGLKEQARFIMSYIAAMVEESHRNNRINRKAFGKMFYKPEHREMRNIAQQ